MVNLFKKCLNAEYIHTREDGDYSIEIENNTLFLLFECSDSKKDWINNFNFPMKPYKRMCDKWYCHRGFLKVWKAMRDEIEIKVAQIMLDHPEIEHIKCVGYSHGGPLSLLAMEDLIFIYGNMIDIKGYGFGSPRCVWGYLPKAVKERMKNFTVIRNIPDIVTHVPPVLFGFKHAGKLLKIGKHFKYFPIKAHYSSAYINELTKE